MTTNYKIHLLFGARSASAEALKKKRELRFLRLPLLRFYDLTLAELELETDTGEGQTLLTHTELCEGPYILGTCLDTDTCELEVEDEVVITDVGVVIILVLARAVGCTKGYLRVKAEVLLAQPVELDGWQYVPKTSRRYHI